jgi:hypothetical protein
MILRYIKFLLIHDGIGHLLALIIYPISYILRDSIRKDKEKYLFLWYFLNDGNDYGDQYFQEVNKRGDDSFSLFKLSYKWSAIRNPLHNYGDCHKYYGNKIKVYSKTTCHREGISEELWRTIKTKNINDIFKDKHGEYIDYSTSILGSQWYVFTINGIKYFRKSRTLIIPLKFFKVFFIHEHKFGFGDYSYETQFHNGFKKMDIKSLNEFNFYENHKK